MSNANKILVCYRHIGPDDSTTPRLHLPLQRTWLRVVKPITREHIVDAIMLAVGAQLGFRREDICDVGLGAL